MSTENFEMRDCPRYRTCNAPLCPLDPLWMRREPMANETFCPYLRELGKPGDPRARFADRIDIACIDAAIALRTAIAAKPHPRWAFVEKQIARATETPSLIEQEASQRSRLLAAGKKGAHADSAEGA